MVEKYILDPDGDCLLVLQRACKSETSFSQLTSDIGKRYNPNPDGNCLLDLQCARTSNDATSSQTQTNPNKSEPKTPTECDNEGSEALAFLDTDTVHVLVSSKHMMLASSVFRAMLQHRNRFKEGEELWANGAVEIQLPDDDANAFLIIISVVHGKSARLPEAVSFDMLYQIAILVDKYDMHGPIQTHSGPWIKALMRDLPTTATTIKERYQESEILRWLCISWVFNVENVFEEITKYLIDHGKYPSKTADIAFPVPQKIIDTIDRDRQNAIESSYMLVSSLIEPYIRKNEPQCKRFWDPKYRMVNGRILDRRFDCDSMVLGSLMKSSIEYGFYPPSAVRKSVYRDMSVVSLHRSMEEHISFDTRCSYCRDLRKNFLGKLSRILSEHPGLDIKTFRANKSHLSNIRN